MEVIAPRIGITFTWKPACLLENFNLSMFDPVAE
jgi:hypothetical protein